MQKKIYQKNQVFFVSLIALIFSCLMLLFTRILFTQTGRYSFLVWNLFLGVIPLLFAFWHNESIKKYGWKSWTSIFYFLVWFCFLPNSFYMISDLIHINATGEISVFYDSILILDFVLTSLIFGYISLLIVHKNLTKKIGFKYSHGLVLSVILISSFAIYLGRYLRWNSWDVAVNPAGLIYDVTDKFIDPFSNIQSFGITFVIFIFLSFIYFFIYNAVTYLKSIK